MVWRNACPVTGLMTPLGSHIISCVYKSDCQQPSRKKSAFLTIQEYSVNTPRVLRILHCKMRSKRKYIHHYCVKGIVLQIIVFFTYTVGFNSSGSITTIYSHFSGLKKCLRRGSGRRTGGRGPGLTTIVVSGTWPSMKRRPRLVKMSRRP